MPTDQTEGENKNTGTGMNISSLRKDELDNLAIADAINHPDSSALDLCSGDGAMALEFSRFLQKVTAWDVLRPSLVEEDPLGSQQVRIIQKDIRDVSFIPEGSPFDIVLWQRAIHYLTYSEAINMLFRLKEWISPGGRLYISASGFDSELGENYRGKYSMIEERFDFLSTEMQEKHAISKRVCLYRISELVSILGKCGYMIDDFWYSDFGNVKVAAHV